MTLLDIVRMAEQCGIPESQADNILRFAFLVVDSERQRCVEKLMLLHEQAGGAHNYYQFAAEQLKGKK